MNEIPQCGYCQKPLTPHGFLENRDDLGLFVAETWRCETCGYRLEKTPIYLDEDEPPNFQTKIVSD